MRMLKLLVSSLFVSVLFLAAPAHAKKVTMNIGYSVNEGHPYGTFMNLFAERFQTLSGGTVRVKVHCCHKMGSEQEQFKKFGLTLRLLLGPSSVMGGSMILTEKILSLQMTCFSSKRK